MADLTHGAWPRPGANIVRCRIVALTPVSFVAWIGATPVLAAANTLSNTGSNTGLGGLMLPTAFIGEAATLALAFAAPALCAGGYLLLKRAVKSVGVPAAIGVGLATVVGGIALAIGVDPRMLTKFAGL